MARKRESMRVVRDRIKPLLVSVLFAIIAKSLMTNGFETAFWFTLGLAMIAFGLRHISRFNPSRGYYDTGWRLYGIPLKVFRAPLSDIKAVKVQHKIHRGKHLETSDNEYPDHHFLIYLQGKRKQQVQLIRNNSVRARQLAEQLAKCIHCPFHDGSQGRVIKRSPEELDMSLGQRLHHRGLEAEYPNPPNGCEIEASGLGHEKQIKFPSQPLPEFAIWIFIAILVPITIVLWFLDSGERIIVMMFIIPIALFLMTGFISSARPSYLWISPDEIGYRRFPFHSRMKMQDLEEIFIKNTDMLLISDKKVIGIPYNFYEKEEARYIRKLIEHIAYCSAP